MSDTPNEEFIARVNKLAGNIRTVYVTEGIRGKVPEYMRGNLAKAKPERIIGEQLGNRPAEFNDASPVVNRNKRSIVTREVQSRPK